MKILHVASSYPLYPGDGTAPFMEEMLGAQAGSGHEVTVIVPRVEDLEEGQRSGVRVIGAPYAPRRLQVWGYGRSLDARNRLRFSAAALTPLALGSMALALRSEIRQRTPDVVHFHWVLPQGVAAFGLPEATPVVISAHGADARFARGRLRKVARKVLERTDALIAASSQILEVMAEIYPGAREKSHVIPHGANPILFRQLDASQVRRDLGLDQEGKVILAVGRLVSKKGFDILVEALGHICDPAVELVIVGEGPERQRLQEMAGEGRLRLVGQANRSDVAKWLAAADVIAIPSIEFGRDVDSGPVVLMEALASGRPVVATPIGMAPDVIKDDVNGFLVDPKDSSSLSAAIVRALESGNRLGNGARRSFELVGDWDRVAADLEQVYAAAAARRSTESGSRFSN